VKRTISSSVEAFEYASSSNPLPVLWEVLTEIGAASHDAKTSSVCDKFADREMVDRELSRSSRSEEIKNAFEAGREQGVGEARAVAAGAQLALLREEGGKRAKQAIILAGQLAAERDQFLQKVEHEVVKLALAIAARILRREAQVDPLFLLGAVRVALGQLGETTKVKLRIPACDVEVWTDTIAHLPNLKITPSVIADDHLQLGECVIESDMGSVDLGVAPQIHEAERILFYGSSVLTPGTQTTSVRDETEEGS
jgi:flagellar biosynthesis/type III secretory pathway protein FliH